MVYDINEEYNNNLNNDEDPDNLGWIYFIIAAVFLIAFVYTTIYLSTNN